MEGELSKKLVSEFQEAFRLMDKDGDGCITDKDVKTVIESLEPNSTEAELLDMIGVVNSGDLYIGGGLAIGFGEFIEHMTRYKKKRANIKELKEAFRVFDKDESGFISAAELREVIADLGKKLTNKEVNELIHAADVHGDGKINFEEFAGVWID